MFIPDCNEYFIKFRSRAKGIGSSITLPEDVTDAKKEHRVLMDLADSVSDKLRRHLLLAGAVSVEIRKGEINKR